MPNHGARTLRRTLASTPWLLLLAGLSCKYNVTLPWEVPVDASAREPDASFDQASSSLPDLSLPSPDAFVCPGKTNELTATRIQGLIVVAIDRSASMQQKNFDSGTKMQAAWAALNYSIDRHPLITFPTIWFPGINCGTSTCCANTSWNPGGRGPESYGGCGFSDAGCQPPPNDSPSHNALKQANDSIKAWWAWSSALVLVTDQNPSCAADSTPDNEACNSAISRAAALVEQGFRIFVVVPTVDARGTPPDCLKGIAKQNAPKFPDAQSPMPAKNSQDLSLLLDSIASGVEERLCGFKGIERTDQIEQIRIGGRSISHDDSGQEGWRFVNGQIELSQEECKNVGSQKVTVVVCSQGRGQTSNWP